MQEVMVCDQFLLPPTLSSFTPSPSHPKLDIGLNDVVAKLLIIPFVVIYHVYRADYGAL